jgi:hypothetical protein
LNTARHLEKQVYIPSQEESRMKFPVCLVIVIFLSATFGSIVAQTEVSTPTSSLTLVPRLIKFSGVAKDESGNPITGVVGILFSLYKDQYAGSPLWMETQNVQADAAGHYTVLLGSASADGVPLELFGSGEARWLGVQIQGQLERPRIMLVSVPYALKAHEAETLSGRNISDFVLANDTKSQSNFSNNGQATSNGVRSSSLPPLNSPGTSFALNSKHIVGLTQNGNGTGQSPTATTHVGLTASTASTNAYGVFGNTTSTTGVNVGVFGQSASSTGIGILGKTLTAGGTPGVFVNQAGSGLILQGQSGSSFQQVFSVDASGNGSFSGNLNVTGKLTKGSGSFKIDHPLDPANKYLSHSFVESPDMMNIYNGVVVLNARGSAWITMPDYFEALNRDFRYQLTSIGRPQPSLYIAQEMSNQRFRISGGKPGGKVSWMVTGIRQDAYANAHRIPTEEEKPPQELGRYLHPELFGASQEQAIGYRLLSPSAATALPQVASGVLSGTE